MVKEDYDARITSILSFSKDSIASIPNNPIAVSFKSILWNVSSITAKEASFSSTH
jgi:hypothetical protein